MSAKLTFHLNLGTEREVKLVHSGRLARGGIMASMSRREVINCKVCLRWLERHDKSLEVREPLQDITGCDT